MLVATRCQCSILARSSEHAKPVTAAAAGDRRAAPLIEGYSVKLVTRIGSYLKKTGSRLLIAIQISDK
jgi:hypothetical protein